jgi:hypothetical protein
MAIGAPEGSELQSLGGGRPLYTSVKSSPVSGAQRPLPSGDLQRIPMHAHRCGMAEVLRPAIPFAALAWPVFEDNILRAS